jgi:hypothetical protein
LSPLTMKPIRLIQISNGLGSGNIGDKLMAQGFLAAFLSEGPWRGGGCSSAGLLWLRLGLRVRSSDLSGGETVDAVARGVE